MNKKYLCYSFYIIFLLSGFLFISSCGKLQKDLPLELPPFHSELSIECYLEQIAYDPNCPFNSLIRLQAAVSQTQDYFGKVDTSTLLVKGATVTISYDSAGQTYTDTLKEEYRLINTCDTSNLKLYNYKSFKNKIHFHTGLLYKLKVDDKKGGRVATAETEWLEPVNLDTLRTTFNAKDTSYNLVIHWKDATPGPDYYRVQIRILNLDSSQVKWRGHPLRQDVALGDDVSTKGDIAIGTRYQFKTGDKIEVRLYHIRREYFQYLRTVGQAANAMGNPFGQPATISTNIQGNGTGIFTVLPWTKKEITIK